MQQVFREGIFFKHNFPINIAPQKVLANLTQPINIWEKFVGENVFGKTPLYLFRKKLITPTFALF